MKKLCFVPVLLCLVLLLTAAQELISQEAPTRERNSQELSPREDGTPELVPRRLYIDITGTGGEYEQETITCKEYLKIAVFEQTDVVLVESPDEKNATLNLSLTKNEEEQWTIRTVAVDDLLEKPEESVEITVEEFSIDLIYTEAFPKITEMVREQFPAVEPEVIEVVTERIVEDITIKEVRTGQAELTIEAAPGTEIIYETGDRQHIGEQGSVSKIWPYNTTVLFRVVHPDYFDEKAELFLEEEDTTYTVQQKKYSRWGLDGRARMWEGALGLGGLFFLKPNYAFINLYVENNFLSIRTAVRNDVLIFISPVLTVGSYIFPPEFPFRIALSGGVYTRIMLPADVPVYFSKVDPVGIQLGVLGEFSPWDKIRFFVEYTPRLFYSPLTETGALLINNTQLHGSIDRVVRFGGNFFFHYGLLLNVGLRILF